MKLKDKDKLAICELKKEGMSYSDLSKKYKVNVSTIKYLVRLEKLHGEEVLKKKKNCYYSPEYKTEIIEKVLTDEWSIVETALHYALPSYGMLSNWIKQYIDNGYLVIEKKRGRKRKVVHKKITTN